MSEHADAVARTVWLNNGTLTGKTRLQKTVYFFEEFRCGFGFDFEYYHYGPYSEDLSDAADDAILMGSLSATPHQGSYGVNYVVFETKCAFQPDDKDVRRKEILSTLRKYDAIVVELAATADFLEKNGYEADPWAETQFRKASKAVSERVAHAKELLASLRSLQPVIPTV
ncbi:MAG: hypothetical protein P4L82_09230 [Ancalomicrobiaceae bacterium]|nr:hypothetical protein [Ancalomicrobiaceae bacterium]MDR3558557.1 hypothetical protein [Candidatus Paceibacterota bacterium]